MTLSSVTDITQLLLTLGCHEVQDENVFGVSLTTVSRRKERQGFFSLVLQYQWWEVGDVVHFRKIRVTLVCSSWVNHGEHSFYRVSRNKDELILMEIPPLDTGHKVMGS